MLLTDRDVKIVKHVAELRFMTRQQISRLVFPGLAESVCKRRLTLLYHSRFLDRIHLPVASAHGSSRAVYCLDEGGARLLWRREGLAMPWRRREADREAMFLEHTLDTNDVRVAFTLACRRLGLDLDWMDERELRRRGVVQRFRSRGAGETVILPDAYFTIGRDAVTDGFALEVDRATVSEKRMRARMAAYGEWAASGTYRRKLPSDSFRVVFAVTDTKRDPRRLERLKEWCEEGGGRSLFWFLDRAGLNANVLRDRVWRTAGETIPTRLPLSAESARGWGGRYTG